MENNTHPLVVFISTPLEQEHVDRIKRVAPDRVEVLYEPNLFPPTRYTSDHKGVEDFQKSPEQEARWRQNLAKADILWDFPPKVTDGSGGMELAPNVKWVQTTSSGVGSLVKSLGFQDSDLLVSTAGGVHAGPLAEFLFMGILVHQKGLSFLKKEQRAHHWERYCGDDLAGKTLAIVGAGRVGLHVAKVGRCFGMRVVAADVEYREDQAAELGIDQLFTMDGLYEMLGQGDVVVLCIPHTPATEGVISMAAFNAMKEGVIFSNISRGQVVDETALIETIRSGKIAFAILDVFASEPLPDDSPLWDMPNVIVSPHSASTVGSENKKITDIFCHNLQCFVDGRLADMKNVLDKDKMY